MDCFDFLFEIYNIKTLIIQAMNGIPPKKKKNTEAYKIPTAQSMKGYKPIVGKQ